MFNPTPFRLFAALVVAGLGFAVPSARATTFDWSGATSGNMSGTTANWGGTVPTGTDVARFNSSLYTNAPTANANLTLGELLFDAGNTAGVTFGSGSSTLTLNGIAGVGLQLNSGSGAVSTGSAKFALAASQSWQNDSSSALTVGGTITKTGNVSPFTLTVGGAGNTTLSGIISNGGATGTLALVKNDAGALTLSGANTFTGGVTLNAGTLNINSTGSAGTSGPLGNGGTFTINGGIIDNTSGSSKTVANLNPITLAGDFAFSTGAGTSSNNLSLGGAVTMGASRTITTNGSGTLTFSGAIGDGGNTYGLTKTGAGTLTLSGANTFTGGVTIQQGTLKLGNAAGLGGSAGVVSVTSGAVLDLNGQTVVNTNALTLNGTGISNAGSLINSSATQANYAGAVTLGSAGTTIGGAGDIQLNGGVSGSTSLIKVGSGSLLIGAASTYTGDTYVNAGSVVTRLSGTFIGTIYLGEAGSSNAATFQSGSVSQTISNPFGLVAGATGTLGLGTFGGASTPTFTGGVTGTNHLTIVSGTTVTFNTGAIDHAGTLTNTGASISLVIGTSSITNKVTGLIQNKSGSTLQINNANTAFFGDTTVTLGTLNLRNTNSLQNSVLNMNGGTVTFGTSTASAITSVALGGLAGSGNINLNNTLTVPTAVALTIGNSNAANGSGTSPNTLNPTYSGVLSNTNGAASLTKVGSNTQTLAGANTYTGVTTVTGGTLAYTQAGNGGAAGGLGQSSAAAASLLLGNGTTLSYTGSGGSTDRLFTLNGTSAGEGATLDASGSGAITYTATGALAYGTANQTRTLTLGGSNTGANSLAALLADNGSGALSLTKSGVGSWALSGTNSYTGGTTLNAGTLAFTTGGLGTTGTVDFGGNATLQFGAATTTDLSSRLGIANGVTATFDTNGNAVTFASGIGSSGTGALTKAGTGTLTLSGANSYTGTTTVSAGVLNIQHATALGSTAAGTTVSSGAALQLQGGINIGTEALTLSGLGVGGSDGALHNISGSNSYGGALTLAAATRINSDAGTLTLTNTGTLTGSGFDLTLGGSGDIVVDRSIATGVGNLIKDGTGSVTLNAANSFTGTTTISAGTLKLGVANALASTSAIFINNAAGAVLDLNGFDVEIGSLAGGGTAGGGVSLGSTTLTVGGDNSSTTFASNLTGTGGLTKVGTGTFTLTQANAFTGATTVSAGTLAFNAAAALGSTSAINLADTTTLTYTGGTTTFDRDLAVTGGTGFLRNTGGGTLTLSGILTKSGTTLTFAQGLFDVTGTIAGASANSDLVIDGATVTLSHANTYNGPTSLKNGASLTAAVVGALPTATRSALSLDATGSGSSTITFGADQAVASLNGAASSTVDLGAHALTVGTTSGSTAFAGVLSGAGGSLVKDGASALTLTGLNTYTGATTVSAGTLTLNAAGGALAHTSGLTIAGTVSLGAANQIKNTSNLNLNGGTLALNGFDQTLGSLDLNANSTLDLSGSADLVFADSSGFDWNSATLTVLNFSASTNTLRFGTAATGLTATQLALFRFLGFGNSEARIDADGFLAPLSPHYLNSGGTDFVISPAITGTTTVTQSGTASTTLTGANTSTGLASVIQGTLVIGTAAGGNWAGDVTVSGTGTLKGRGTITGAVVLDSAGTYSPGNSPAIQNVGSLTVNSGSFVTIELDGATAGNGAGFHDQIVSAGAVTLNGGTLSGATIFAGSSALAYVPAFGASHTIITGSAITGTFAAYNFAIASNAAGVTWLPEYTATAVNLFAVPDNYATLAGLTPTQTRLGAALQSFRPAQIDHRTATTATGTLFNGLMRLDLAGLRTAYDQLSPEKLTALAAVTFQSSSLLNSSLLTRSAELRRVGPASVSLNGVAVPASAEEFTMETVIEDGVYYQISKAKPKKRVGYFAGASGAFAAVDGTANRLGSFSQTGAGYGGLDYTVNENQSLGLVVSQTLTDTDFAGASGSARTTTSRLGVFHDYHRDGFYLNSSASVGFSSYESKRTVGFLSQTASGETQGLSYGGQLATGYDFKVGNYIIGPTASLAYDHARIDGFGETGSAADLNVGRQNADSLVTALGIRMSRPFFWNRLGWIPEVSLGVSRQHFNPNAITAQFAAGGDRFKVQPQDGGGEFINPGASLTVLGGQGWSVRLGYSSILSPSSAEHRVDLSVNAGF